MSKEKQNERNPHPSKKQLSTSEAKALIPILKTLNKSTKLLIKLFNKKLSHQETQTKKIRVLIEDMLVPPNQKSQISVTTLDMGKTFIKEKNQIGYNQIMKWEKDYRNRNKGTLL